MAELSTRRFGEAVARIRNKRQWSRAKLIARLLNEVDESDPNYGSISETWLKRLENGEMVKLTRATIEAVIRALRCPLNEKADLLLYADRNVLLCEEEIPNPINEMLNYILIVIQEDARIILKDLVNDYRGDKLTDSEQFELAASALELAIKQRSKR